MMRIPSANSRPSISEKLVRPVQTDSSWTSTSIEKQTSPPEQSPVRKFKGVDSVTMYKFGAGLTPPDARSELAEFWHPGINIHAGYGRRVGIHTYSCVEIEYSRFNFDEAAFSKSLRVPQDLTVEISDFHIFTIMFLVKTGIRLMVERSIYFNFGAGFYRQSVSFRSSSCLWDNGIISYRSRSAFILSQGLGMSIPINSDRYNIFVEGNVSASFPGSNSLTYFPLKIGIIRR